MGYLWQNIDYMQHFSVLFDILTAFQRIQQQVYLQNI